MILPGLVNAHSHLEYAVYAGFGDGRAFGGWLATHIARKRGLDGDEMVAIARLGAAESLAAGITTTADYSFSGAAAAAANELGLRAIVYLEVFGGDPAEAERRFAGLRARRRRDRARPDRDLAARALHLLARHLPLVPLARDPRRHASRRERRRERVARARAPARSPWPATCSSRRPGSGRSATLAPVLGPELLSAHCVTVERGRDRRARARRRPRRALPALERPARLRDRAADRDPRAGIRVGLGTDSPASTPSFDPWEEMRAAVCLARARDRRPDALDAASALKLATLGVQPRSGLEDELGSLSPGKRADITVVSLAGSAYHPIEDPTVAAVFAGTPSRVVETIVDGETRYRRGVTEWPEVRSTASAARQRMLA